ncbi:hypothetical protein [Streptomyces vastus]|uniref:hypothetical protein n=1 Tax=Streptomyces vastus TaxID=285451 RepID=UPI0031D0CA11
MCLRRAGLRPSLRTRAGPPPRRQPQLHQRPVRIQGGVLARGGGRRPGAQIASLPQPDPSFDEAEQLWQIITGFYRTAADEPLIGRLFVDELNRDGERLDHLYEHYISPVLQTLVSVIDRLVASGRMTPVPLDVLFFAVIPPVAGMLEMPLARRPGRADAASPQQLTATAEALAELVVNGLLAAVSGTGR